ncbi:MAG: ribosome biogenesis GTPase Der [Trueperaceae bacterium]|nr:ribosome biogenesis GTPase Der [Trueperaceae bacterium]
MRSVAIVGRPNVGKSSLFNRLLGRREAIVDDAPGVTRDVKEGVVTTDDHRRYRLLDTGGLWSGDGFEAPIRRTVEEALRGTDLVLFCIDGRTAPTDTDHEIAAWLRRQGAPVLLVGTKVDDPRQLERPEAFEAYALGFGAPHPTSALHRQGGPELDEAIMERLGEDEDDAEDAPITVAIIGRPNAGKSSLVNTLVGGERVIVSPEAGTTRDAIDVAFTFAGRPFVLVDTAGIRRKPEGDVAYYAKLRAEAALRRAEVAVLVVDPFELGDHEMRIANTALQAGKPVVLAVNKWDLVEDDALVRMRQRIDAALSHLAFAPRVYVSARTDYGMHELLASVVRVWDTARRRVPTSALNVWTRVWTQRQAPPNFSGRPLKLLYATQADVAPPTFVFSVNSETMVTRPFEQYLRNRIREDLGFAEVPFRMIFKNRDKEGGKRVRR